MPDFDFTQAPGKIDMSLMRDTDFARALEVTEDSVPFPAGSALEFRFDNGVVWAAQVTPTGATWYQDKDAVNALIDKGVRTVRLVYTNASATSVWAGPGSVIVYD